MAADSQQKQPGRGPGRRFQKGASGNPNGRKKGTRNQVTVLAEKLMNDDAEAIVRAVLGAAREGDMTAAKIVLDRIAPIRKGRPLTFVMPSISTAADVTKALAAVAKLMAAGDLTPEEASSVVAVIEGARKAIETEDLERRIVALEQKG
jgi:hypothetical protein